MQSKAVNVDDYIAEAPADRREALTRLRALCQEILTGTTESVAYGMAAYHRGDDLITAFASQKNYLAFYAGQGAIERHAAALKGIDCGKGCIRYKRIDRLDFTVARSLVRDIAAHKLAGA